MDLRQELTEALLAAAEAHGLQLIIAELDADPKQEDLQEFQEGWDIGIAIREFNSMQFDGIVEHFTQEITEDLTRMKDVIQAYGLFICYAPMVNKRNAIKYLKVVRKKECIDQNLE